MARGGGEAAAALAARHGFEAAGHSVEIFDAAPPAAAGAASVVHLSTKGERHGRDDDGLCEARAEGARLRDGHVRAHKGDFGKFSMRDQLASKRWTILFFYPADSPSSERPNSLLWQSSMTGSRRWAPTS